jgi:hypothetical protein
MYQNRRRDQNVEHTKNRRPNLELLQQKRYCWLTVLSPDWVK